MRQVLSNEAKREKRTSGRDGRADAHPESAAERAGAGRTVGPSLGKRFEARRTFTRASVCGGKAAPRHQPALLRSNRGFLRRYQPGIIAVARAEKKFENFSSDAKTQPPARLGGCVLVFRPYGSSLPSRHEHGGPAVFVVA
jgi:hypothetical protein